MLKIALVFALLSGCGQPASDGGKPAPAAHPVTSAGEPSPPLTPSGKPAMLVETLPACSPAEEGWIVYLVPAAELQACESGSWTTLLIKGDTGETGHSGRDGADGAPGKAGAAGAQGIAGAAGAAGTDGKPISANVWADPVSDQLWLIGGTADTAPTSCTNGWRLPTPAEIVTASSRGIFGALASSLATDAAYECGWTTDSSGGGEVKPGYHHCFVSGYQPHPLPWGIYCLKDG